MLASPLFDSPMSVFGEDSSSSSGDEAAVAAAPSPVFAAVATVFRSELFLDAAAVSEYECSIVQTLSRIRQT